MFKLLNDFAWERVGLSLSWHRNAVRPARQSPVNPSDNPAATDSSPHTGARIASSTIVAADVFTNGLLWGQVCNLPYGVPDDIFCRRGDRSVAPTSPRSVENPTTDSR